VRLSLSLPSQQTDLSPQQAQACLQSFVHQNRVLGHHVESEEAPLALASAGEKPSKFDAFAPKSLDRATRQPTLERRLPDGH
jgi:hypothetical protein